MIAEKIYRQPGKLICPGAFTTGGAAADLKTILEEGKKWYFVDWYYVSERAARIENQVAVTLYRYCRARSDMGYGQFTLHFVRTLDKREIDFLVVRDNRPLLAVEVKTGHTTLLLPRRDRRIWFSENATLGIQVVDQRHNTPTITG